MLIKKYYAQNKNEHNRYCDKHECWAVFSGNLVLKSKLTHLQTLTLLVVLADGSAPAANYHIDVGALVRAISISQLMSRSHIAIKNRFKTDKICNRDAFFPKNWINPVIKKRLNKEQSRVHSICVCCSATCPVSRRLYPVFCPTRYTVRCALRNQSCICSCLPSVICQSWVQSCVLNCPF